MLNKYILKLFQVSLRECRNIYIKVPFIQKDLREVEITKNIIDGSKPLSCGLLHKISMAVNLIAIK